MKEFNLNTASIRSIKSAAITEYTQVSDNVARVIATFVGNMERAEASNRLGAVLKGKARPISASFRWLTEDRRVAIGYVSSVRPVRAFKEDDPAMKKITANLFMDAADESLWELKPGQGGKYLARQGQDNLAELLEASRVSPRGSTPKMRSILTSSARVSQFLAYVDVTSAMMDYGFVTDKTDDSYTVVSSTTNTAASVQSDAVVGIYTIDIPEDKKRAVASKIEADGGMSKADQISYWTRLYSYAPEYLAKVITQVEQMSAL